MIGIYKIVNKLDESKFYIGRSVNIKNRWKQHIYEARHKEGNAIHKAIRKYGKDNFRIEVLEELKDTNNLAERELYWYAKLKPYYNEIEPDSLSKFSKETSVKSFNPKTGEVKIYKSISDASRFHKISNAPISAVCRGIKKTCRGLYWAYLDNDFNILENYKIKTIPKISRNKRPIKAININTNEELIFQTVTECANRLSVERGNIAKVIKGERSNAKGYKFEYLN